ncbi:Thrombopoietin [Anas platyrhynchos]|uniref:Thrombopoietin n=1 Tax=Anas platyrhynchos TaxID=8839 RepID=R0LG09_ANAPL|nr:Thrombopoietin [Anas platyrhynchos]
MCAAGGLLLLTSFLLHVKEGRASPARLVCDDRLIYKYIEEAKDMEKKVNQCQAPSVLSCPVTLPLVDVKMTQWKTKSNQSKRREILCNLMLLLGAPPQEEPWEPGCSPGSKERNTAVIFLAYQRLLQGKLRFFFYDLAKDLCNQGQGGGRDPPRGA